MILESISAGRVASPGGPYCLYTFSEQRVREFDWPERLPDQATVFKYVNFVAGRLDMRHDIWLGTRISGAAYDESPQRWNVETDKGETVRAPFLVCATGALSTAHTPPLPGLECFAGECYHTGRWLADKVVSFAGKRSGVISTGSSGIQSIPVIAKQAPHLTVFQRTAQYTIPAGN